MADLTLPELFIFTSRFKGLSANDDLFNPPEWSDPEFQSWMLRTLERLVNLPTNWTESDMRRALTYEGWPSPEWAGALHSMMQDHYGSRYKRKAT